MAMNMDKSAAINRKATKSAAKTKKQETESKKSSKTLQERN
jgi:hypothetical protein